MKKLLHFIKRLIQNLLLSTAFILIAYVFLGLCNWSTDIGTWTGLSRFLFGVVLLVVSIASYQAMATTVMNFRRKPLQFKKSETIA